LRMALTNKLTAIGDAIRAKTGDTAKLTLDEMAAEIADIPAPSPAAQTYMNYAANGLTTISQDADWPIVREYGFSKCNINAQLKNIVRISPNGFYGTNINVPLDFSKVTYLGSNVCASGNFTVTEDTTYSFDALQTLSGSNIFYTTRISTTGSLTNPIDVTFTFPSLVSNQEQGMFRNVYAVTSDINSVTFDLPVLTTARGQQDFQNLGGGITTGTEYIINLPELTSITYNPPGSSFGLFATNSYSKLKPLRINAPKLAIIKPYMFLRDYLRELILDWNSISEIGVDAFDSSNYEGMYPALPSVTTVNNSAFLNASTNLQDTSTTPYVWKVGNAESVFADQKAFSGFSLYNYDGTLRPVVLDFPSGLTATTFTKSAAFQSYNYSSPISIVIRNSTVPTLTYSPTASNGIFGGALQPGQQVYVPRALLADYKAATNWSVIANNIVAIEDYPDLLDQ
jgi:hypothetical protein